MKRGKTNNLITYLISMGLPAIIFAGVLFCVGNYPFGDRNFTIWDMDYQYLDFFAWLKRVFNGDAGLTYSFGKSLGDNTIGLFAFYLSSPFNLLLIFFDNIQLFVVVLFATKIAFCGLTCSVYLRKRFDDIKPVFIVLLSVSYALMSYNLKQMTNIMWLDGAVFLPLMMLGVYRLVSEDKKILLYVVTSFAIIANWYTAYMSCLFSVFYFLYEISLKKDFKIKNQIKGYFITFIKYCITMILSVLSVMFFFLPMTLQLLQGKGIESGNKFAIEFRCSISDILKALVPAYADTQNSDTLILFCGTLTVIGIILFFISRKVSMKQKIFTAVMFVILVVSDVFVPTEKIWNGFRKVASYYSRSAFVICFFMVIIAATYFNLKKSIKYSKIMSVFLSVLVIVELFYNAGIYMTDYSRRDVSIYNNYKNMAEKQVNVLKKSDNSAFYRIEQTSSRVRKPKNYLGDFNEGMAYGFSQLSSYSSTYNGSVMKWYVKCGYSECSRIIMFNEPILLSDSLLGIKYLLSREQPLGYRETKIPGMYNDKKVYENPYALGLGYMTDRSIFKKIERCNSFEYQNKLLSAIVGRKTECFKPVKSKMKMEDNRVTWTMNSPKCENVLYGYLTRRGVNKVDLYVNGKLRTDYSQWSSYKTVQISNDEKGKEQAVSMEGKIVTMKGIKGVFYYLDMREFKDAMEELKAKSFYPDQVRDGYVEGNYEASEDGEMLMTVPFDGGWKIRCNGNTVKAKSAQGVFTVIPVKKGKNHITMTYVTPGLKKGIAISIFGIVCFVIWQILENKKKRVKENV